MKKTTSENEGQINNTEYTIRMYFRSKKGRYADLGYNKIDFNLIKKEILLYYEEIKRVCRKKSKKDCVYEIGFVNDKKKFFTEKGIKDELLQNKYVEVIVKEK